VTYPVAELLALVDREAEGLAAVHLHDTT
jgi:hypothetical protein